MKTRLLIVLAILVPVFACAESYLSLGYAPSSKFWGCSWNTTSDHSRWGWGSNLMFRGGCGDEYYDNISPRLANSWGDRVTGYSYAGILMSVNRVYKIGPRVIAYGGLGLGMMERYEERYDSLHILGDRGRYTISDSDPRTVLLYSTIGIDIGIKTINPFTGAQLLLRVGYDLNPDSIAFGLGVAGPS